MRFSRAERLAQVLVLLNNTAGSPPVRDVAKHLNCAVGTAQSVMTEARAMLADKHHESWADVFTHLRANQFRTLLNSATDAHNSVAPAHSHPAHPARNQNPMTTSPIAPDGFTPVDLYKTVYANTAVTTPADSATVRAGLGTNTCCDTIAARLKSYGFTLDGGTWGKPWNDLSLDAQEYVRVLRLTSAEPNVTPMTAFERLNALGYPLIAITSSKLSDDTIRKTFENYGFTFTADTEAFGVCTDTRKRWITDIVRNCETAGVEVPRVKLFNVDVEQRDAEPEPAPAKPIGSLNLANLDVETLKAVLDRAQQYEFMVQERDQERARVAEVTERAAQLERDLTARAKKIAELEGQLAAGESVQAELAQVRQDYEQLAAQGGEGSTGTGESTVNLPIPTETDRVAAFRKACERKRSGYYITGSLDRRSGKKGFAVLCAERRKPLLIAGPSGSGKTELLQDLNAHLFNSWCQVNFDDGVTRAQLICRQAAVSGQTYWELGPLVLSMLAGVPIILDEIDHCDTASQSALHEAVRTGKLFVPELNRTIIAKSPWWPGATANAVGDDTGMYHGAMGTAFRDRFAVRKLGYPTLARETKIIAKQVPDADEQLCASVAGLFAELRKMDGESVNGPFSVRQAVELVAWVGAMTTAGHTPGAAIGEAVSACLTDRVTSDEAAVLNEVAQRYLASDAPTFNFEDLDPDGDEESE